MKLYLLRHALAASRRDWRGKEDRLRPLTRQGIRQITRTVRRLYDLKVLPGHILSSPYTRCRQTAEIAADGLNIKPPRLIAELEPGVSSKVLMKFLSEQFPGRKSLMLVGHEPDLSGLIRRLLAGSVIPEKYCRITFEKGGFCELEVNWKKKRPKAVLTALIPPRFLI